MSHDIFISYSSKDKPTADAICHVLEENKLKCWIAPRNIRAGQNYPEQIMDGLRAAKLVVLVFSKNSQESVFVYNEIDAAFSFNKSILSFKIDETLPENKMGFFLKTKHWLDAYPDPESVFETLVNDAKLLCEGEGDVDEIESQILEETSFNPDISSELEQKLNSHRDSVIDVVSSDEEYREEYGENEEDIIEDDTDISSDDDDDDSGSGGSAFSKYKIPIIAAIVILIAVLGFALSGGLGSNDSTVGEDMISIDYVEVNSDGESYYVFGSVSPDIDTSAGYLIHTDFYDSSDKVIKSNESKLTSTKDSTLCKCLVGDEEVAKVSVELRDSSNNVVASDETTEISN